MNQPAEMADPWFELGRVDDVSLHATWLACLVAGLGGEVQEAVLVLADPDSGDFRPAATWPGSAVSPDLAQLCEQALEMQLPLAALRGRGLMAHPILRDGTVGAVVAVAFGGAVPRTAAHWIRWGQGWLERRWQDEATGDDAEVRERLLLALDLTMIALEAPRAEAAAHALVAEAATRLGCDRVSVGFAEGPRVRFAALSHSADVTRRIDLVHAIEAAMDEALDQAMPIYVGLYPTQEHGVASPYGSERPGWIDIREHNRLMRDFGAAFVLSVPFAAGENEMRKSGVFVFEWPESDVDDARLHQAEALAPILGSVLLGRRRSERAWRDRFWEGTREELQRIAGPFEGRRKLLAVLGIAVAVFLAFVHGDYRLSSKATLEGGVRRVIVAPYDGFVAAAHVRAGHVVKAGEEMALLDDRDMRLEASRWASQQAQFQKQSDDAQAQHNLAQIQIALAQAKQAAAQRELSEAMLDRSRVVAPFDGVIVSGDLSQHLGGAVRKGQTLFEIAPLDAYRVVLQVEESDIAHVAVGQEGELMVAALPGATFPFRVSLVTPVATTAEGRNHFRVEATLALPTERLRPGMEGIGKIEVGRELLSWIWTHHFFDWLRLQAWSWLGV